jgi:hypothetical protein
LRYHGFRVIGHWSLRHVRVTAISARRTVFCMQNLI